MTSEWYPAIEMCCRHWPDASMLQHTYAALEQSFDQENDACIDCAKSIVEVICRIIIGELDDAKSSVRPPERTASFGDWVSAAVRVLKLGDVRHNAFQKVISNHHRLTTSLGDLRKDAGPVSHGKEGFIEKLSTHHRRAAVLSADAIVAFLHNAYLEAELNLAQTREPYERFSESHALVDMYSSLQARTDENGLLNLQIFLPDGDILDISTSASKFLFHIDRVGYVVALNAAKSALVSTELNGEELQ